VENHAYDLLEKASNQYGPVYILVAHFRRSRQRWSNVLSTDNFTTNIITLIFRYTTEL